MQVSTIGATQRLGIPGSVFQYSEAQEMRQLKALIYDAIDRQLEPLDLRLAPYLKFRSRIYARVCRLLAQGGA